MGTDIHMFVEVRAPGGVWHAIPPSAEFMQGAKLPEHIRAWMDAIGHDNPQHADEASLQWELSRNYDLFALLASVRNGKGFAGVDTGTGFVPIKMPRGLPKNLSPELKACLRVDHTPSYLTLHEISTYKHWRTGVTVHRGWVNAYIYRHWVEVKKRVGPPAYASGGVSGGNTRLVEQSEMDRQLATIPLMDDHLTKHYGFGPREGEPGYSPLWDGVYTIVEWPETYREAAGEEWWRLFEIIQGFGVDPKHVRLVFYFDS